MDWFRFGIRERALRYACVYLGIVITLLFVQTVDSSPIERSHRDVVFDICWVQSKTMTEFCSASPDGTISY